MQNRVRLVVGTLISALETSIRTRVERIPIIFDPSQAEVNAFATCSRTGKPAIAVTNGMLTLTTNLAQLKAVDDTFGTRWVNEYTKYVAQYQQANTPLLAPPSNWLTTEQRTNRAVLARQLQIFDEMIAFTFGHELAHHYLNHLPCTSVLPLESSELGVLLTDNIPAFNQPNESAADVASVRNILNAPSGTLGYKLTETGGLVQLRFFTSLDSARPIDVFTFERTHPPPSLRESIVNSTAQAFRLGVPTTLPWLN
jgi:hypothetical protein